MSKKKHGGKRVGAGRKTAHPEGVTIVVAARVPEPLVSRLDAMAETRGWNRSEAVTEAIRRLVVVKKQRAKATSPSVDAD